MNNWKYKLDISDIWSKSETETPYETLTQIIAALKASRLTHHAWMKDAIEQFEDTLAAYGEELTSDDFNYAWDSFYTVCDVVRLWVELYRLEPINK